MASALFGPLCAPCHGETGRGDGPAAHLTLHPPSDLTRKGAREVRKALVEGVATSGMPAFAALEPAQLDALVAYVEALRTAAPVDTGRPYWPPWPQGKPPADGVVGLSAERCATCHPTQHAAWKTSRHAKAMGPGVVGQYHDATPKFVQGCDVCHAPLHEQRRSVAEPGSDEERPSVAVLRAEAVTCAACHLRGHRKHGPIRELNKRSIDSRVTAKGVARFGRSDFCLPCHNLPLTVAVNGRPLLDTWREWAASPYLTAGVQCQDCHQPDGDHGFRGAHDLEMARRAVRVEVGRVATSGGEVSVDVTVHNHGAGHHFPTTATPKAVLAVRQLRDGQPLYETVREWPIFRDVEFRDGRWHERADTRIPAGGRLSVAYEVPRAAGADAVQWSLRLMPDALYTGFFEAKLGATPSAAYRQALDESRSVLWLHVERRPL